MMIYCFSCLKNYNQETKETEIESLAKIIESTGENGTVSEKNQKIIHLFSTGEIDYEIAVYAIKKIWCVT